MRLAARRNLEIDATKRSEEVVDSGPQTLSRRYVLWRISYRPRSRAAGELTGRILKLNASQGGKPLVDGGTKVFLGPSGCWSIHLSRCKKGARLGLHRAAVERGADLEPALDRFVEIADG